MTDGDDPIALIERYLLSEGTDGLPIVPPTPGPALFESVTLLNVIPAADPVL